MISENKRLQIAFITSSNPMDVRSWSGIHYFMAQALQRHCGDVSFLGPVHPAFLIMGKVVNKICQILIHKRYDYGYNLLLSKRYASIFARKISNRPFDLIFAPVASTEIAFLKSKIPIVYLSGTTFATISQYYPEYSNLLKRSFREGNIIEESAIRRADLIIYPSEWAVKSALQDYHAAPSKIHVVPYGANIAEVPPSEVVLQKRRSERCRLLFLAKNWERKGGNIAFDTLLRLEEMGLRAELIVCGCRPPSGLDHPRMSVIPFLNKSDPGQHERLNQLLLTSDFLLLPTRAECFGVVFCEASAFGLPSITTDTGGVPEAIRNGENGILLPIEATGVDYAKAIHDIYRDDERYRTMVRSSRKAFEERLNWDTWGIEVNRIIQNFLEGK